MSLLEGVAIRAFPALPPTLQQQLNLPASSSQRTRRHSNYRTELWADTQSIVTSIPGFVALYRWLTTEVLPSREGDSSIGEYDLDERLRKVWVQKTERAVLIRALREVAVSQHHTVPRNSERHREGKATVDDETPLDIETRQLCYLVSTYLSILESDRERDAEHKTEADLRRRELELNEMEELMRPDLDHFSSLMSSHIAPILSTYIEDIERTLGTILEAVTESTGPNQNKKNTTNTSDLSSTSKLPRPTTSSLNATRSTSSIPPPSSSQSSTNLSTVQHATIPHLHTTLLTALTSLTTSLGTLLSLSPKFLTSQIRALESTSRIPVGIPHSQFLATVAEGIYLKTRILELSGDRECYANAIPVPIHAGGKNSEKNMRIGEVLGEKYRDLEGESQRLEERERRLRSLLAEYDSIDGGSRFDMHGAGNGRGNGRQMMRELGVAYKGIEDEIEELKRDIERLEAAVT